MNRRKFLTGVAGVTAAGVVLAKEPITTQLSPPSVVSINKFKRDGFGKWRNNAGINITELSQLMDSCPDLSRETIKISLHRG